MDAPNQAASQPSPTEPALEDDQARPDAAAAEAPVSLRTPQFAALDESAKSANSLPLDRFYDVNIHVWAELGHLEMPIGELMHLGDGTVVKLNRPVSHPVDLMAQGVRVARGEVVVIDDCFAVRITEIENAQKPSAVPTPATSPARG